MSKDLAFHPTLWAYDTGRTDRIFQMVIKILSIHDQPTSRPDHSYESEVTWSPQELDSGDPVTPFDQLAVVVGELIPAEYLVQDVGDKSIPERRVDFKEKKHYIMATRQDTKVVVWTFEGKNGNLSVLHGRNGDIRSAYPLAESEYNQIVFYDEWTRLDGNLEQGDHLRSWCEGISAFVTFARYQRPNPNAIHAHTETPVLRQEKTQKSKPAVRAATSSRKESKSDAPHQVDAHEMFHEVLRGLSLYQETHHDAFLNRSLEILDPILSGAPSPTNYPTSDGLPPNTLLQTLNSELEMCSDGAGRSLCYPYVKPDVDSTIPLDLGRRGSLRAVTLGGPCQVNSIAGVTNLENFTTSSPIAPTPTRRIRGLCLWALIQGKGNGGPSNGI
ncbi:hypothetical protein K445DRAFT_24568 [Daldinia sp. EC12]|nr:hypothetical protein K445DRAFT_24568 [Daldinia sp. EC12]